MAEHIDKTHLNQDLRYRFNYISQCLDFTQNDINIINLLASIIFPVLPNIVEHVYKKLYSFDITQNYFLLRNDGFESFQPNIEYDKTLISTQVDYRKDMLSVYFRHVLTQNNWDDTFLQYLSRIGEFHTYKSGSSSINVDYIHINTLLSLLEDAFISTIYNTNKFDDKIKLNALRAINKFFWIQNDFFTIHYDVSMKGKSVSSVPIINFTKCYNR